MPAAFNRAAAYSTLRVKVSSAADGWTAGGRMPARQLTRSHSRTVAYSIARSTPGLEFVHPIREAGDATLTGGPVAGRQVVQDLTESVGAQLALEDRRRRSRRERGTRRR